MVSHRIGLQRLINHGITDRQFQTPQAVVQHLGAVQAQDYKQSLWAIGSRMTSAAMADVETAVAAGTILRTWAMRGTIHFIPAEDTKWMLELCASRILAGHGTRMQQLELTEKIMSQSETIIRDMFQGKQALTRSHLLQTLENAGISTAGQRGYHILWHLAHQGVLAIGPMAGSEQTFVLLHDWVPQMRNLSREEALTELVTRYFTSHAPATEQDFARWSGLTLTDTRRGIAHIKDNLQAEKINGTTYYFWESSPIPQQTEKPAVRLLAAYDEFLLGYKDRGDVLPAAYAEQVVPGNNGVFQPMIVADGEIIGIWKREIKPKNIRIDFYPFTSFEDLTEAVLAEAQIYSSFMSLPLNPDSKL